MRVCLRRWADSLHRAERNGSDGAYGSDIVNGSDGTYCSAGGGKPECRAETTTTPPGRSTAVPWLPPTFARMTAK